MTRVARDAPSPGWRVGAHLRTGILAHAMALAIPSKPAHIRATVRWSVLAWGRLAIGPPTAALSALVRVT